MSETKFTPGPWRYEYEDGYCGELIGANGGMICTFTDEPNEANANLIAAAPDLYEALKEVLLAERLGTRPPETAMQAEEKLDRIKHAVIKAEAALAKARGEQ